MAAFNARTQFVAYLEKVVNQRRTDPRDDLITALVQAEEAGDHLSQADLFANAMLLLSPPATKRRPT